MPLHVSELPKEPNSWSHDGRALAFVKRREPLWSSDGRELYYRNGDRIMVVAVDVEGEITIGKPRVLLEVSNFAMHTIGDVYHYHVSHDGRSLTIVKSSDVPPPAQFHFVLNWFEELKRIVPTE